MQGKGNKKSKRGISVEFGVWRKWSQGKQLSGAVEEGEQWSEERFHWRPGGGQAERWTSASRNITVLSAPDVSVSPKNKLGKYPMLKAKETFVINAGDGANRPGSEEALGVEFLASDAKKNIDSCVEDC